MIAPIQKGESFKGIVEYNFHKVAEGKGAVIGSNLISEDKDYVIKHMVDTSALGSNSKRKNVVFHTSLNLPPGEKIEDDKFRDIAEKYLSEMGYTNNPYVIVRHDDTLHSHVHIIACRVDYEGNLVSDSNDFYRSKQILRELEKEFGLTILDAQRSEKETQKLQERNALKYQFSNSLNRAIKHNSEILDRLPKNVVAAVKSERQQLTDSELKKLYYSVPNGREKYKGLQDELVKGNFVKFTPKQRLSQYLSEAYQESSSKEEYIGYLKERDIYYRELQGKKGTVYIQYGIKGDSFYLGDSSLSRRYQYATINNLAEVKYKEKLGVYRRDLKREVLGVVRKAHTAVELKDLLNEKGIDTQFAENSGGVYGVSFKKGDLAYMKGSDLDRKQLSWTAIKAQMDKNGVLTLSGTTDKRKEKAQEAGSKITSGSGVRHGKGPPKRGLKKLGNSLDANPEEGQRNLRKLRKKDKDKDKGQSI